MKNNKKGFFSLFLGLAFVLIVSLTVRYFSTSFYGAYISIANNSKVDFCFMVLEGEANPEILHEGFRVLPGEQINDKIIRGYAFSQLIVWDCKKNEYAHIVEFGVGNSPKLSVSINSETEVSSIVD